MSGHKLISAAAALLVSASLSSTAFAQTTPVQPQPHDPNMPAQHNTVPEKIEPNATGSTGSLSDKLGKTDGVITPSTNVDPGIAATPPAPHAGTMPVIPPPGSPGGNPNVQPK